MNLKFACLVCLSETVCASTDITNGACLAWFACLKWFVLAQTSQMEPAWLGASVCLFAILIQLRSLIYHEKMVIARKRNGECVCVCLRISNLI